MSPSAPRVEMLWWEGCPSWGGALEQLRAAMTEVRLDAAAIELREVPTEEQARSPGFGGAPTTRVDGRVVQPPPAVEPLGLTCGVYRLRDGRLSPTRDPTDLREALSAAQRR